jgi:hypothetical protein
LAFKKRSQNLNMGVHLLLCSIYFASEILPQSGCFRGSSRKMMEQNPEFAVEFRVIGVELSSLVFGLGDHGISSGAQVLMRSTHRRAVGDCGKLASIATTFLTGL